MALDVVLRMYVQLWEDESGMTRRLRKRVDNENMERIDIIHYGARTKANPYK